MDCLAPALVRNSKRQQLQANERQVAGDGFMLNLVSVLQLLCAKSTSKDYKECKEKKEKGKEANFQP